MKKINLISILLLFIAISFYSCNNDDILNEDSFEYLDVNIDNFASFTSDDWKILDKAKARVEKYVTIKNEQLVLSVKTGKEISISERLFNSFIVGIENINQKIENLELVIFEGKLYSPKQLSKVRVRTRGYGLEPFTDEKTTDPPVTERVNGLFGWEETTYFTADQGLDYSYDYLKTNITTGIIMGVAGLGTAQFTGVAGAFLTAAGITESFQALVNGDKIRDAAKQGPIAVEYRMDYITGSMSTTVYDKNGNSVCGWVSGFTAPGQ